MYRTQDEVTWYILKTTLCQFNRGIVMKKKLFKGTALMLSAAILGGSLANTTSVSAQKLIHQLIH